MPQIYIHAGMQKTGTSFLQERCFPHLRDIRYVGISNYRPILLDRPSPPRDLNDLIDHVIAGHWAFYDRDRAASWARKLLEEVAESAVLISRERLFGNMDTDYRDQGLILDRLRHLFPGARALLVIRRQDELLESIYRQSLQSYRYYTINAFLTYRSGRFEAPRAHSGQLNHNVDLFDLRRSVRNFHAVFGRDHVLVLPYELLRHDRRAFLERVYTFLGVEPFHPRETAPSHRSYGLASCYMALALNRFVRVPGREIGLHFLPELSLRQFLLHVVDRILPFKGRMISRRKRALILERHCDSNRRLDEELGLELKRFGYY